MKKFIIVCLALALAFSTFSCGGGGGSGSARHPKGENPGEPSLVKLQPSHFIAQTNASISLHAKVLDGNGDPVQGENVTFTNLSEPFGVITSAMRFLSVSKSIGSLSSKVVKTNKYGVATANLTSTTEGFATVQAEVNKGTGVVRDKKTVFFSSFDIGVPTLEPTLSLAVDDGDGNYNTSDDLTLFKTENDNERTVRAIVYDEFGQRVEGGGSVFFDADTFEVSFLPSTIAAINNDGEAFATMQVDPGFITDLSRVINIGAFADNGAFDMLTLFLTPLEVDEVIVNSIPSVTTTNGISSIFALVKLTTGGVAPDGTSVNFSATCNGNDIIMPAFAQTTDGIAAAQFIAPSTEGLCEITASVGGVSGMTTVNVVAGIMSLIPATQTISEPAVDDIATYTIRGGVGPYTAVSSNPGIVSVPAVPFDGPSFDATVLNVPSGDTTVTITVYDSRPIPVTATATLILDVDPPVPLRVNPLDIEVTGFTNPDTNTTDDVTFYIRGGVPPYSMFSDNAAVVLSQGLLPDNTFTIDPEAVSTDAEVILTVEDSLGATVTIEVTVWPQESFMSVNPQAITVVHPTTIPFNILGGLPDYTIFPNVAGVINIGANPLVTAVPSFTGSTVCPGSVTLQIVDSDGSITTSEVTVVVDIALGVLPATLTLVDPVVTNSVEYTISGGVSPYTAISSHPNLVSVSVAGSTLTATIIGVPAESTTVTITVIDSCNSSVDATLEIDIQAPPEPLAVDPTSAIICENDASCSAGQISAAFTISGGTAPYTATSDTPGVIPNPTVAGNSFNVNATNNSITSDTPVTITVEDSSSTPLTQAVTVTVINQTVLSFIPPSATVSCTTGGTRTFFVSGGTPEYTATSTDPVNVTISPLPPLTFPNSFDAIVAAGCGPFPLASNPVSILVQDNGTESGVVTLTVTNP